MYTIQSPVFQSTIVFQPLPITTLDALTNACLVLHHQGFSHYIKPSHQVESLFYEVFTPELEKFGSRLISMADPDKYLPMLNALLSDHVQITNDEQWLSDINLSIYRLEYCLTKDVATRRLAQTLIMLLSYAHHIDKPYKIVNPIDTSFDLSLSHERFLRLPYQEMVVHHLIDQLFDFAAYCFDLSQEDVILNALDQVVQTYLVKPATKVSHED